VLKLIARDCVPGGTQQNLLTADGFTDWGAATQVEKYLLTDAQTSGGLLFCIPAKHLKRALDWLRKARTPSWSVIGQIERAKTPRVRIAASGTLSRGNSAYG
jgi:selenophosphate synthase